MTSRLLTLEDMPAIQDLVHARDFTLGVDPSSHATVQAFSLGLLEDLLKNGLGVGAAFGLFDGDQLNGLLVSCLSSAHPCYFVRKAHTRPGLGLTHSVLSELFSACIEHHEQRGFERFYTLYRSSDIGIYHRLWRTSSVLKNYVAYTDLEMQPNIRPKYSDFWELLFGRTLYNVPMSVRGFVRKSPSMVFNEPN